MNWLKIRVHAAMLTVGLIYGANYSIAKSLMPEFISPFGFILLRVFGAFILFNLLFFSSSRERVDRKDLPLLALCALFGVAGNMLMFFQGLSLTSPVNASVIMTVNPVIVLGLSAFLLKEKVTSRKIIGIALGMTGALLQILDPFGVGNKLESVHWSGDLLVFLNAASYAAYLVLVKPLMEKYRAITVVRWTFSFGLLMVLPFGFSQALGAEWASIDLIIALKLGFVILGTTVLAYLLNAWSLRYVQSSLVGVYIYLQPIFASLIAILFAGYRTDWPIVVYALLIFSGVYLVSVKGRKHGKNHGN